MQWFFLLYLHINNFKKNMNNLIIKRSQIAEAVFTGTPAVGKKYPFTQIPNISRNNIVIYGMEVFTASQLTVTPSGKTIITAANSLNVVITFVDNKNVERIFQIPYSALVSSSNGGFIRMVKPFLLNLTKCYVQLVGAGTVATSEAIAVNFYYSIVGED